MPETLQQWFAAARGNLLRLVLGFLLTTVLGGLITSVFQRLPWWRQARLELYSQRCARFNWKRLFQDVYSGDAVPVRPYACPPALLDAAGKLPAGEPKDAQDAARFRRVINAFMEQYVVLSLAG